MVTLETRVEEGFLQGMHRRFRRGVLPMAFLGFGSLLFNGCGKKDNPINSYEKSGNQEIVKKPENNFESPKQAERINTDCQKP